MRRSALCIGLLAYSLWGFVATAQSSAEGNVLITGHFSSGEKGGEPPKWDGASTRNIPETLEIRDGAIACTCDGKAHGKSIDLRFKVHHVRVSHRIKFEGEGAKEAVSGNRLKIDTAINAVLERNPA